MMMNKRKMENFKFFDTVCFVVFFIGFLVSTVIGKMDTTVISFIGVFFFGIMLCKDIKNLEV